MRRVPKVLVADDIREVRDILRLTLARDYDVVVARNGEEAWELFNAEKPDIVLTDLVMPRINGMELCRRIKLQSFSPQTPVVIISAATSDRELADGFWGKATGSDAYITKPFTPHQVLSALERLLDGRAAQETVR
jgi:CheY-like chemotaxis protein